MPSGVSGAQFDNAIYDISPDANGHPVSTSGWGHPDCGLNAAGEDQAAITVNLIISHPIE